MKADHREGTLYAPCGFVVGDVPVNEGDSIEEGDSIITLRNQQMITSPVTGQITELHILPNQPVKWGDPLANIQLKGG